MKVYSLTGKSGTGKSYQAMNLCNEENIESIIDDGLFIYHSRVEAGISASARRRMWVQSKRLCSPRMRISRTWPPGSGNCHRTAF